MSTRPTHPGELLKEDVLPALGLDEGSAARELDVTPEELGELLSGRLSVNAEWALRLGQFCGNGPFLWMDMQAAMDLWEAQNRLGDKLAAIPRHQAIIYSANELTKLASAAGSAAYKAIIRTGGGEASASIAYRRAYSRAVPPCWANILPPPMPPRSGS